MPFVDAENVCRVELVFLQQGQYVENVFHVFKSGGWDEAAMEVVAGVFIDWVDSHYRTRQTTQVALQKVLVTDLTTETSPAIEYAVGLPLAGTNGSSQLPMNVTLAIKLLTALRGRSFRGRYYFVGLVPAAVSGSTLVSGVAADYQADTLALIDALDTNGTPLGVVSFVTGGAPRAHGLFTPVTGVTVNPTTDSQRRRLPERGT